ncbi:hypothetical protein NFI96_013853 [Prochilodus magdalenae]|nr:hypothetical protein NFI96_013853 [Prochilodus magdalenae]
MALKASPEFRVMFVLLECESTEDSVNFSQCEVFLFWSAGQACCSDVVGYSGGSVILFPGLQWDVNHIRYVCKVEESGCTNIMKDQTNRNMVNAGRFKTYANVFGNFTMLIRELNPQDSGVYRFGVGNERHKDIELTVQTDSCCGRIEKMNAYLGETATFTCNYPDEFKTNSKNLYHLYNQTTVREIINTEKDSQVEQRDRSSIFDDRRSKVFSVNISGVREDDGGVYLCGVWKKDKSVGYYSYFKEIQLQVTGSSLIISVCVCGALLLIGGAALIYKLRNYMRQVMFVLLECESTEDSVSFFQCEVFLFWSTGPAYCSDVVGYSGGSVLVFSDLQWGVNYTRYVCKVEQNGCTNIMKDETNSTEVNAGRFKMYSNVHDNFVLLIRELNPQDSAVYRFGVGTESHKDVELTVQTDSCCGRIEKMNAYLGETATFTCNYPDEFKTNNKYLYNLKNQNSLRRIITTGKDSQIEQKYRSSIFDDRRSKVFIVNISGVREDDGGVYLCGVWKKDKSVGYYSFFKEIQLQFTGALHLLLHHFFLLKYLILHITTEPRQIGAALLTGSSLIISVCVCGALLLIGGAALIIYKLRSHMRQDAWSIEMVTAVLGENVTLSCSYPEDLKGEPKFLVRRNDDSFTEVVSTTQSPKGRFSISDDERSNTVRVEISHVRKEDAGSYSCTVIKALRSSTFTWFQLEIIEPPPPPEPSSTQEPTTHRIPSTVQATTMFDEDHFNRSSGSASRRQKKADSDSENDPPINHSNTSKSPVNQIQKPNTIQSNSVCQSSNLNVILTVSQSDLATQSPKSNNNQSDPLYQSPNSNTSQSDSFYQSPKSNTSQSDSVYQSPKYNTSQSDSIYHSQNSNTSQTDNRSDSDYESLNSSTSQLDSVYQSQKSSTSQSDSVYQSQKSNTSQSDSVYQSPKSNTSQSDSVYQSPKSNTSQSDSVYQIPKSKKSQSDSVCQSPKSNTSQSDSVYQSPKSNTSQSDSVYQSPKSNTSQTDSVYQSPKSNTSQSDSVYQSPKSKKSQSDSVYQSPKSNTSQSDSVYQSPKSNTSQSDSVYQSPTSNTSQSDSVYQSPKSNTSQSDSVYQSPKSNTSQSDSVYQSPKSNTSQSDSVYQSPKSNTSQSDSVYQSQKSNKSQSDSVYQSPKSNTSQSDSVFQSPKSNTSQSDSVYQSPKFNTSQSDSQSHSDYENPNSSTSQLDSVYQRQTSNTSHSDSDYENPNPTINQLDSIYQNQCCTEPKAVKAELGKTVNIDIHYPPLYYSKSKLFFKLFESTPGGKPMMEMIGTDHQSGRFSIYDDRESKVLSVRISNVREDDGGVYYCGVWNRGESVSYYSLFKEVHLQITGSSMKIVLIFALHLISGGVDCFDVIGYPGGQVMIFCTDTDYGIKEKFFCKLQQNQCLNKVVTTQDSWTQTERLSLYDSLPINHTGRVTVMFRNLSSQDAGLYQCGETGVWSHTVNLTVNSDPCCGGPKTETGYLGETVTITCPYPEELKSKPVYLSKSNRTHSGEVPRMIDTQRDRFSISDNRRSDVLSVRISDVREDDGGVYYCAVWISGSPVSYYSLYTETQLDVMDPCCGGSKTVTGYLEETVTITCPYPEELKPKPVYLCKLTGKHSVPNIIDNQTGRFSISNNRRPDVLSVRISDVREDDRGVYYCAVWISGSSVSYYSFYTETQLDVMGSLAHITVCTCVICVVVLLTGVLISYKRERKQVGSTQWLSGAGTGNWDAVSHTSGDYEELRDSRVYSTIPFYSLLRRPTIPSGHPKAMYTLAELPKIPSDPVNAVYATAQAPTIPSDPANAAYATAPVPKIPSDPTNAAYASAQVPTIPSDPANAAYATAPVPKIPSDPTNAAYATAQAPTIPSDPANAAYATAQVPTIPSGHPKTMYTLAELPTIPSDPANAAYATAQVPTIPSGHPKTMYTLAELPTIPSDPANAAYATAPVPKIPSDPTNAAYASAQVPTIPSDPTNTAYATAQVPTIPSGHPKAMYTLAELPKIPSDPVNAVYATAQAPTIPSDPANAAYATAPVPKIPSDPTNAAYATAPVPTIPSDPVNAAYATAPVPTIPSDPANAAYATAQVPTIPSDPFNAVYDTAQVPTIPSDPTNAAYATAQVPTIPSGHPKAMYTLAELPTIPSDPANTAYATAQEPTIPSDPVNAVYATAPLHTIPSDPTNAKHATAQTPTIPSDPANAAYANAQVPTIPSDPTNTEHATAQVPTIRWWEMRTSRTYPNNRPSVSRLIIILDKTNDCCIICKLQGFDGGVHQGRVGSFDVMGYPGGQVMIFCTDTDYGIKEKYFCKLQQNQCLNKLVTTQNSWTQTERLSLIDSPTVNHTGRLTVMFRNLSSQDAGLYQCGETGVWSHTVNLTVNSDPCCGGSKTGTGYLGETVTITCPYPEELKSKSVYLCKSNRTHSAEVPRFIDTQTGRFSISDNRRPDVLSVRISDVREDDGGVYYCAVWISGSPVSYYSLYTETQLDVMGPVGSFDVIGYPGGQVMIFCTDTDYGIKEKYFCKLQQNQCLNKLVTTPNSWTQTERLSLIDSPTINHTGRVMVMFRNLSSQDAGLYQCGETGVWSHTVNLTVNSDPCCDGSKIVTGYLGETVTITCPYSEEFKSKSVYLCKSSEKHSVPDLIDNQRDRFSIFDKRRPDVLSVRISDVREDDGGVYYCAVWISGSSVRYYSLYTETQLDVMGSSIIITICVCATMLFLGRLALGFYKLRYHHTQDSTISQETNTTQNTEAEYENDPPQNQNIIMNPAYQNLKTHTNQLESVYQSLNQNTNQSALAYQNLSPNTNQSASTYQILNPNTNQSDSVYQSLNQNTNQSASAYQSLNPNTNQSASVYQSLNPNTNQSDSVYQTLNPNTYQSALAYQSLNPNTNQSASAYQTLNPNINQSALAYQSLNPNTNQSASAYQSLNPNTNQSALAYQNLSPNINQSASTVTGYPGETVNISCPYPEEFKSKLKLLYKLDRQYFTELIRTTDYQRDRFSISEDRSSDVLRVRISDVREADGGVYYCAVWISGGPVGYFSLYTEIQLDVMDSTISQETNTTQNTEAEYENDPPQNQNIIMNPAYQNLNLNTNQLESVYQTLNPNTNQSDSVYQSLNQNTNQLALAYQTLNPNTNQSALAYQSLNPNTNQSASVYQTLNRNINQSHSVYQTLNPNTNQSDSVYQRLNHNTNPASAYQILNPNTNQSDSVYHTLNPNTNLSASGYQNVSPNTNQSASVYQTLNPNTNQSASVYQTLNSNTKNQIQSTRHSIVTYTGIPPQSSTCGDGSRADPCCGGSKTVTGYLGETVTINCPYPEEFKSKLKVLYKLDRQYFTELISTTDSQRDRFSISDNRSSDVLSVRISDVREADGGVYYCAVWISGGPVGYFSLYTETQLDVMGSPAIIALCVCVVLLLIVVSVLIFYTLRCHKTPGFLTIHCCHLKPVYANEQVLTIPSPHPKPVYANTQVPTIRSNLPTTAHATARLPTIPPDYPKTAQFPTIPPDYPTTAKFPTIPPDYPTTAEFPTIPPDYPTTAQFPTIPPDYPTTAQFPTIPPDYPTTAQFPTIPLDYPTTVHAIAQLPTIPPDQPITVHVTVKPPEIPSDTSNTFHATAQLPTNPSDSPNTVHLTAQLPTMPSESSGYLCVRVQLAVIPVSRLETHCEAEAGLVSSDVVDVMGYSGCSVIMSTGHGSNRWHPYRLKFICKVAGSGCMNKIYTSSHNDTVYEGRFSLYKHTRGYFAVLIRELNPQDAGVYRFGVVDLWQQQVNLIVQHDTHCMKPMTVTGHLRKDVKISCDYSEEGTRQWKFLYKLKGHSANMVIYTLPGANYVKDRLYISDDAPSKRFTVDLRDLKEVDGGVYFCGIQDWSYPVEFTSTIRTVHLRITDKVPSSVRVPAFLGGHVLMKCQHLLEKPRARFFCKESQGECPEKTYANVQKEWQQNAGFSLYDDPSRGSLIVALRTLSEGTYRCGVDLSEFTEQYTEVNVEVKEDPGVHGRTISQAGYIGETVTVTCEYPRSYGANLKHFCKEDQNQICHDISPLGATGRYSLSDHSQPGFFRVTISNLSLSDAGVYWCGEETSEGDISYTSFTTKVQISIISSRLTVREGDAVEIECPYESKFKLNSKHVCKGACPTHWLMPNKPERFSLSDDITAGVFSVNISRAAAEDAGKYWCGVETGDALMKYLSTELQVIMKEELQVTGREAVSISIQCRYRGESTEGNGRVFCMGPQPSICEKGGVKVSSENDRNGRFSLSDKASAGAFTVTITDLRVEDSGTYWCGEESFGSTIYTKVHLQVMKGSSVIIIFVSVCVVLLLIGGSALIFYRLRCRRTQGSFTSGRTEEDDGVNPTAASNYEEISHTRRHLKSDATIYINTSSVTNSSNRNTGQVDSVGVTGYEGGSFLISCKYDYLRYTNHTKYFCELKGSQCTDKVLSKTHNPREPEGRVFFMEGENPGLFNVHFKNISQQDNGTYRCGVEGEPAQITDVTLKVKEADPCCGKILIRRAYPGETFTFTCSYPQEYRDLFKYLYKVTSHSLHAVIYTLGRSAKTERLSLSDHPEGNLFNVRLSNVTEEDGGVYLCGAQGLKKDKNSYSHYSLFNEIQLKVEGSGSSSSPRRNTVNSDEVHHTPYYEEIDHQTTTVYATAQKPRPHSAANRSHPEPPTALLVNDLYSMTELSSPAAESSADYATVDQCA